MQESFWLLWILEASLRKLKVHTHNKQCLPFPHHAGQILTFINFDRESINAKPLKQILDDTKVDNFGWGRSIIDGKAREGTFYVNPGNGGILGTEPSCAGDAPIGEAGYNQPWIQFGRTETDFYYAISSLSIPYTAIDKIELLWTEFNT